MYLRDDQIVVSFYPTDQLWSAPIGVGVLPPTEEFKPGDLVQYYDRPDCIGLITGRAPGDVEYDGLSTWTPENIRAAHSTGNPIRGVTIIDFYTVVWNNGPVRTAGAHMLYQLRHVE